jgi:hypothetical protein
LYGDWVPHVTDGVRDFLRQLRPLLERVSVPRDELAAMAADVRERSEAV